MRWQQLPQPEVEAKACVQDSNSLSQTIGVGWTANAAHVLQLLSSYSSAQGYGVGYLWHGITGPITGAWPGSHRRAHTEYQVYKFGLKYLL